MSPAQLKELRRHRGWDQRRLAEELKVSVHTVRSWEQGKNAIPALVERVLLSEVELSVPLPMVVEINALATRAGMSFEEALSSILKAGLSSLGNEEAPAPKSGSRGKKGSPGSQPPR